jgi:hypothetical protein
MSEEEITETPSHCPVCGQDLVVTRLECSSCGTEVTGAFSLGRLATLREPHASLIEMFLRSRGNMKEMERDLGLSYPTVRARLDEALNAAGYPRRPESSNPAPEEENLGEAIRARVEEALARANIEERIRSHVERNFSNRIDRQYGKAERRQSLADSRTAILDSLDRGEISPADAAAALRELKTRS